jgi:hypothetical protein
MNGPERGRPFHPDGLFRSVHRVFHALLELSGKCYLDLRLVESTMARMLALTASGSVGQHSMTVANPVSRGTLADCAVDASKGASVRAVATFVERGASGTWFSRRLAGCSNPVPPSCSQTLLNFSHVSAQANSARAAVLAGPSRLPYCYRGIQVQMGFASAFSLSHFSGFRAWRDRA